VRVEKVAFFTPFLGVPNHKAFRQGDLKLVTPLLASGADPNAPNQDGARVRPIHFAVYFHRTEVMRLLLAREDIKVNANSPYQDPALIIACSLRYEDIVKLLLARDDICQRKVWRI
jgi:ankyrin repeat protein